MVTDIIVHVRQHLEEIQIPGQINSATHLHLSAGSLGSGHGPFILGQGGLKPGQGRGGSTHRRRTPGISAKYDIALDPHPWGVPLAASEQPGGRLRSLGRDTPPPSSPPSSNCCYSCYSQLQLRLQQPSIEAKLVAQPTAQPHACTPSPWPHWRKQRWPGGQVLACLST